MNKNKDWDAFEKALSQQSVASPPEDMAASVLQRVKVETDVLKPRTDFLPHIPKVLFGLFMVLGVVLFSIAMTGNVELSFSTFGKYLKSYQYIFILLPTLPGMFLLEWLFLRSKWQNSSVK